MKKEKKKKEKKNAIQRCWKCTYPSDESEKE
jgi:hypothetical protein